MLAASRTERNFKSPTLRPTPDPRPDVVASYAKRKSRWDRFSTGSSGNFAKRYTARVFVYALALSFDASSPRHQSDPLIFQVDFLFFRFDFFGTFLPFFRASERPIAIACFRLLTFPPFPPLPRFSSPFFLRCIARFTSLPALFEYFLAKETSLNLPNLSSR